MDLATFGWTGQGLARGNFGDAVFAPFLIFSLSDLEIPSCHS
jgi:hypothetical protein